MAGLLHPEAEFPAVPDPKMGLPILQRLRMDRQGQRGIEAKLSHLEDPCYLLVLLSCCQHEAATQLSLAQSHGGESLGSP